MSVRIAFQWIFVSFDTSESERAKNKNNELSILGAFRECVDMKFFCANAKNLRNFTVDQRACKPNGLIFCECI